MGAKISKKAAQNNILLCSKIPLTILLTGHPDGIDGGHMTSCGVDVQAFQCSSQQRGEQVGGPHREVRGVSGIKDE